MTHGTPPFSADAALRHFRSYFTEPRDVVAHPQLSRDEKAGDIARMGTGCPPPVYVRVRKYGWRRREHAWTGGRVHRGPGAIATMTCREQRVHANLVPRAAALSRRDWALRLGVNHHFSRFFPSVSQSRARNVGLWGGFGAPVPGGRGRGERREETRRHHLTGAGI